MRRFLIFTITNYFCKVKKLLVFIIALLYLVSASGVVVDIHYCLGDVTTSDECCSAKTKAKWLKLQDAHHHAKVPKQVKQFSGDATVPRLAVTDKWIASGQYYSLRFIATPDHLQDNDIYLRNCVLRI